MLEVMLTFNVKFFSGHKFEYKLINLNILTFVDLHKNGLTELFCLLTSKFLFREGFLDIAIYPSISTVDIITTAFCFKLSIYHFKSVTFSTTLAQVCFSS